ncbi:MAG: radical SAM family heme chaperone HemW [Oscillospiraceae bacterium]
MKQALRPLGLYIHIPFCRCKCAYCDFYSLPGQEAQMDGYLAALSAHLAETAPQAAGHVVDTVYFGGGTPTVFGAARLAKVLKLIRRQFHVAKDAEVTLEANPESARDVKALRALRRAGFNRISLGVQATDDAVLRALGRVHSFSDVRAAVEAVRAAGIRNLSLDLMYGLPGQDLAQWRRTLADAAALAPEHLSCYALKLEEGTPLYARRDSLSLPDDDAQAEMYLAAVRFLAGEGYEQYEISNFAKPGLYSRHNMKYWTLQEYAGFGPGAHSDFGEVRYAYERDLTAYLRGELRLSESERIPLRERAAEYLMLGLRTARGVERREFENRFRRRFAPVEEVLRRCEAAGYARRQEERWRLTPEGFLVSNAIILEALEALQRDPRRRPVE